jgi:plasmid stability protein
MSNLTIVVEDEVLKRARIRAMEQGTSVNALLREYLESFSGTASERRQASRDLVERSRAATSKRGGRRWTREELHDRSSLR